MKRCIRCGSENRDESKFCHDCGFRLEATKPAFREKSNIFMRFKNANKITKIIMIFIALYIVFLIIGMIPHLFFGVPLNPYTEESQTQHATDFYAIDMDGDGALSFDEADGYAPDIDNTDLSKFFDFADKNDNGLLVGGEFDSYILQIDKHYKDLEKQQKAQEEVSKEKSSSNSIPSVENNGKCPSCGSDESYMYEYYDEFGRPYYQCTVCDYMTYDEEEFYY
ncbi:MAG: zinc-ribbon domain-containing protein [Methanobrevibacter sp.]|uniref:zinc ribbon domain-containing protein n=1 Tax=Methanobrevibacter sp. TaxID=66852 RepID=UPI0025F969E3|nr:zinc ribbon domain-containing protein [Methanobrevibacter sp.]MBQ8017624.1 zinc-ribbon domain-containing protein [Methanobrevibacter sp.]